MDTSNVIALLALAVSLISIWFSYRSDQLSKTVAAAEKRTNAHTVLVSVLLEAEELLNEIRIELRNDGLNDVLKDRLKGTEDGLINIIKAIPGRLNWLREKSPDDAAMLEEYNIFIRELEVRMSNLKPDINKTIKEIKELNLRLNSLQDERMDDNHI